MIITLHCLADCFVILYAFFILSSTGPGGKPVFMHAVFDSFNVHVQRRSEYLKVSISSELKKYHSRKKK